MKRCDLNDTINENLDILRKYETDNIIRNGSYIHHSCRKRLGNAAKKYKVCVKCKKHLHKAPKPGGSAARVKLETHVLNKITIWRKNSGDAILDSEYISAIHQSCKDDVDQIDILEDLCLTIL